MKAVMMVLVRIWGGLGGLDVVGGVWFVVGRLGVWGGDVVYLILTMVAVLMVVLMDRVNGGALWMLMDGG